jgi:hypothetical protein
MSTNYGALIIQRPVIPSTTKQALLCGLFLNKFSHSSSIKVRGQVHSHIKQRANDYKLYGSQHSPNLFALNFFVNKILTYLYRFRQYFNSLWLAISSYISRDSIVCLDTHYSWVQHVYICRNARPVTSRSVPCSSGLKINEHVIWGCMSGSSGLISFHLNINTSGPHKLKYMQDQQGNLIFIFIIIY